MLLIAYRRSSVLLRTPAGDLSTGFPAQTNVSRAAISGDRRPFVGALGRIGGVDDAGIDGLVSTWTLLEGERALVVSKRAGSRLGFALLLKSFVAHGRFPSGAADFSAEVIEFVAGQLKADPAEQQRQSDHRQQRRHGER